MENLLIGLKVAAIGIGGVFLVLLFLMVVFSLTGKLFPLLTAQKKSKQSAPSPQAPAPTKVVATENDGELVAVISAAIMAILEGENQGVMPTFVIKQIKQIKR